MCVLKILPYITRQLYYTVKCENDEFYKTDQNIDSKLTEPPQTEQGTIVIQHLLIVTHTTIQHVGSNVTTLLNIQAFEVIGRGGRKVKVIESIGSEWEKVAKALDIGQEDIDMIKTTHSDDDEEACCEILTIWLEGNNGEVSWTAFSQALIDAGLPELADSLKDVSLVYKYM